MTEIRSELLDCGVGGKVSVEGDRFTVVGYIIYHNADNPKEKWVEYHLKSGTNKSYWLSIDTANDEYAIYTASRENPAQSKEEWTSVDRGRQTVIDFDGEVDVEYLEESDFEEFEDEYEEKIVSIEKWEDETEISVGHYLDLYDIEFFEETADSREPNTPNHIARKKSDSDIAEKEQSFVNWFKLIGSVILVVFAFLEYSPFDQEDSQEDPSVPSYMYQGMITDYRMTLSMSSYFIEKSEILEYVTSITGNGRDNADVYARKKEGISSIETVANDILDYIGNVAVDVSQSKIKENGAIAIVTEDDYCLIYEPKEVEDMFYIQISDRQYNYLSDAMPYQADEDTYRWYKMHYFTKVYSLDKEKWGLMASPYQNYQEEESEKYRPSQNSSLRHHHRRRIESGGNNFGK